MFTKSVLWLVLLFSPMLWAEVLPSYEFFYSCDSGLVDCGSFSKHWYGDFGLNGVVPTGNLPERGLEEFGLPAPLFSPVASNALGQVIGTVFISNGTYRTSAYGFNGTVYCLFLCEDEIQRAVDINNNGLYLYNITGGVLIGSGRNTAEFVDLVGGCPGCPPLGLQVGGARGLNDADQILLHFPGLDGVLSPFAVIPTPEPDAVLLLASIAIVMLIRRGVFCPDGSRKTKSARPQIHRSSVERGASQNF